MGRGDRFLGRLLGARSQAHRVPAVLFLGQVHELAIVRLAQQLVHLRGRHRLVTLDLRHSVPHLIGADGVVGPAEALQRLFDQPEPPRESAAAGRRRLFDGLRTRFGPRLRAFPAPARSPPAALAPVTGGGPLDHSALGLRPSAGDIRAQGDLELAVVSFGEGE